MAVTNTLAYYDSTVITAVKSFIVLATDVAVLSMPFNYSQTKQPKLKVKTRPKQLLGYLQLTFALSGSPLKGARSLRATTGSSKDQL